MIGRRLILKIGFFVLLVLCWEGIVRLQILPDYLVPGPVQVGHSLWEMLLDGVLWTAVRKSMARMIIGYTVSVVVGILLGILLARSTLAKETLGTLVLSLQSLPSICWLPLALIWVGINEQAVIAVVILGAVFSIAVATESAIRNIPPIYLKVGEVLGARRLIFARDILFFAALPELMSGLKLGWSFAWRSLMAAELIRADAMGLGRLLETGRSFNDVPMMLAAMIMIICVGLFVDSVIFGNLEKRIRRRYGLAR
ncbi:MAG: ABC transporter permease [Candidatus Hydrogenedentota bacterium]|nr:MAG: ABC transporter permease [Candidatus Hydrogenedentota bacterium]